MRMSTAFPSEYLRAADLQGRQVTAIISRVEMRLVGDDHKPVVFFEGKDKGVVLNKTNANTIASVYGDESDEWTGGEVVLFSATVDFQGKSMEAIRVKIPPRKPTRQIESAPKPDLQQHGAPSMAAIIDDDIPFMMEWR